MDRRVITKPEEREELPVHAVIRDMNPAEYVTVYERMSDGWYGLGLIDATTIPPLPATVLYDPREQ